MMKVLPPILAIITIGLIIGIILYIKNVKENYDKDNTGANLTSMFFPIVGFIIYAVNVGKNNKIAKSCIRMALLGMMCGIAIFLMTRCTLLFVESAHTTHTGTKTIEKVNNDVNEIESIIRKKGDVYNVSTTTKGLINNISVEFYSLISKQDAMEVIETIFKGNKVDDMYDYHIEIYSDSFERISGLYNKTNNKIIWNQ